MHASDDSLLLAWDFHRSDAEAVHTRLYRDPDGGYHVEEEWKHPYHDIHFTHLPRTEARRLYERLRMKMVPDDVAFPA